VRRGGWNWLRIVSKDGTCISIVEPSGSAIVQLIGKADSR
jgi:hypothetical protein